MKKYTYFVLKSGAVMELPRGETPVGDWIAQFSSAAKADAYAAANEKTTNEDVVASIVREIQARIGINIGPRSQ